MSAIDELLPDTEAAERAQRAEADLPRRQAGSRSQHLTFTLLADYGIRRPVSWPSAGIVTLLGEFGVSATAARAALSRLSRRGVLRVTRDGRHTAYQLTPRSVTTLTAGGQRIARFAPDAESWDGDWTLVAFAGAGDGGDPRRLRARLRWLGYAPLYDGLWISPRADAAFTAASLSDVAPAELTLFRARDGATPLGTRAPLAAWDLAWVAEQYDAFLRRWEWLLDGSVGVDAAQALVARTHLMDDYRRFPALDPQLPARLMPDGWPRQRARMVFECGYDRLGEPAEQRVQQVLTSAGVAVPDGVRHHTVADLAAGHLSR